MEVGWGRLDWLLLLLRVIVVFTISLLGVAIFLGGILCEFGSLVPCILIGVFFLLDSWLQLYS